MVVYLARVAKESWLWLIILVIVLVATVPFIVIYMIAYLATALPIWGPATAMVVLLLLWAVVSGYKDWVLARRKEEEEKKQRSISES